MKKVPKIKKKTLLLLEVEKKLEHLINIKRQKHSVIQNQSKKYSLVFPFTILWSRYEMLNSCRTVFKSFIGLARFEIPFAKI